MVPSARNGSASGRTTPRASRSARRCRALARSGILFTCHGTTEAFLDKVEPAPAASTRIVVRLSAEFEVDRIRSTRTMAALARRLMSEGFSPTWLADGGRSFSPCAPFSASPLDSARRMPVLIGRRTFDWC